MNTALQQSKDYSVAGQYLYKSIKEAIANNDRLSVDMDGVTSLPSVFLNVSLGRIIDEEGKDKLKQYVGFVKITKQQALRLRDYLREPHSRASSISSLWMPRRAEGGIRGLSGFAY